MPYQLQVSIKICVTGEELNGNFMPCVLLLHYVLSSLKRNADVVNMYICVQVCFAGSSSRSIRSEWKINSSKRIENPNSSSGLGTGLWSSVRYNIPFFTLSLSASLRCFMARLVCLETITH